MSYKTILTYFTSAQRVPALLGIALPLARRHDAHLIGLTVVPPVNVYSGLAGEVSASLIEEEEAGLRQRAAATAEEFSRLTDNQGVAVEWRSVDSGAHSVAGTVVSVATSADLVIASQPNPDDDWEIRSAVPERLLMEGGRPLLLVPQVQQGDGWARKVLIGWNGRREAARATFDALPILHDTDHVEIITIGDPSNSAGEAFTPADDIAAALARHGLDVEIAQAPMDGRTEGEILLSRAAERDFDLLVIGAYGHSRVSEFIFGGVTRHVLMNMTLPVLLSR